MPKKRRSLVLIPPGGKKNIYIRIHTSIIIVLTVLVIVGLVGFFIPKETLLLTTEELNTQRHLKKQNAEIMHKLGKMLKLVHYVQSSVDSFQLKRREIESVLATDSVKSSLPESSMDFSKMSPEELFEYSKRKKKFYENLFVRINNDPSIVEYVPLVYPVKDSFVISAGFGKRKDPFTNKVKKHTGIDISAPIGVNVIAPAYGTVVFAKKDGNWGKKIVIKHKYGFSTMYAHLETISVMNGQHVKKGLVIGSIGKSGLTLGPHLHYEIRLNKIPVNPMNYIAENFIPSDKSYTLK